MTDANVICIKWGTPFPAEEVNILYRAAKRNTQRNLRFFCLTDDPAGLDPAIEPLALGHEPFEGRIRAVQDSTIKKGSKLRKISMFRPDLIPDLNGPLLALDIDVVITGGIDDLLDYAPGQICMAQPFSKRAKVPTRGEGSVLRFDPAEHGFLYEAMAQEPEKMVLRGQGSEQSYTSEVAFEQGKLQHFPDPWVISFKLHCRPPRPLNLVQAPTLPADARIVCFHGQPSVAQATMGYSAGPFKSTKPAPWLKTHYS